ncbi:PGA [Symbiodinium sp. CCMP2592]|nr:PGA [Symbiodinium sp. CCMP2592]
MAWSKCLFLVASWWILAAGALRKRSDASRSASQLTAKAGSSPADVFAHPRAPPPTSIYGKIYVGVPPQEFLVVFDTSSGNVILPARSCESASCMTKHRYDKLLSATSKQVNASQNEAWLDQAFYPLLLLVAALWLTELAAQWKACQRRKRTAAVKCPPAPSDASTTPGPSPGSPSSVISSSYQDESNDTAGICDLDPFTWCWAGRQSAKDLVDEATYQDREIIEMKFGAPRSEIYNLGFYPINEDIPALVEVAVRDESKRKGVEQKLRQLRRLSEDLPPSGWVQTRDPRVLLRFLLARQCSVERALEMLQSVLTWRQQNGAANALPLWNKVKHERFDFYWKAFGCTGIDREGDPVVFERVGQLDVPGLVKCNPDFIKQHCIYNAECVFASLEIGRRRCLKQDSRRGFQVTVVVDMTGLNVSFMDRKALALCQLVSRVEADNYPEALKRVIVIRAPWIFPAIWNFCKPFFDKGTLEKVCIVKESETADVLLKHIPAESVPKALGGTLSGDSGDDYCSSIIAPGGKIPEDVSFAVGKGNVAGKSSQDKVCLSPQKICADTLLVEATEMSDEPFSIFPFDGVVGLGMPSLSLTKMHNFLGNLADANQLDKDRFAVWIATEDDKEDSEISFGALPPNRLGSEVAWLPLSSTTSGLWQVEMSDVTLNLVRLDVCKKGCHAAFDTGSGMISGPKHLVEAISQELNVATDCSNYDELPALGFELGGVTYNLDKYEYVKRTSEGCFPQLQSTDEAEASDASTFFLGAPFLTRYVTVYDRVFLRMGLAFAVHANEPTGESSEGAMKRLMGRPSLGRASAKESE